MTSAEIAVLVGIASGLYAAFQAWLAGRVAAHDHQLNGLMAPRISAGAATAIAADHALRSDAPTPIPDPTAVARIAALRAELAALEATHPSP